MKKLKQVMLSICMAALSIAMVVCTACGSKENDFPEKAELATAMISEIQFENDEAVKLEQNENEIKISGTINAMSDSQKNAFGDDDVTHVVVVKLTFDSKRTLSYFKISGKKTKVYSDDTNVEGYTDKLSEMLDNESGEDAYMNLILSAGTDKYDIKIKYTDGQEVNLKLMITATLATGTGE